MFIVENCAHFSGSFPYFISILFNAVHKALHGYEKSITISDPFLIFENRIRSVSGFVKSVSDPYLQKLSRFYPKLLFFLKKIKIFLMHEEKLNFKKIYFHSIIQQLILYCNHLNPNIICCKLFATQNYYVFN